MKPFSHVMVVTMDTDRKFYTRHGLHMNNLGKEETATKISMIISRVFQNQNVKIRLCWKYGYNVSSKSVSNQSEGTSVKKVDENPTEGTISLHEAQDQRATNRLQGEGCNSCWSPAVQAPKCNKKLPVNRSDDFLWEI